MAARLPLTALPNGSVSRLSMAPQRNPVACPAPAVPRQSLAAAPRASLMGPGNNMMRQSSIGTTNRQSSIGSTRQSSIGGRKSMAPGGSRQLTDPRNVSDKVNMRTYVNNIIEYLAEHHYTKQISPKMLQAPSNKDFISILEFLYQQYDPTFKIGKPEEDVVFIFKVMKYPFPISKRNLVSVGAQHTWPPFLAALNWMVEVLRAQEFSNDPFIDANDAWTSENPDDKQFFEFICKSYPSWLDGNDDTPSLDAELEQNFETRNSTNQAQIDNLNAIREEVLAETQAILDAGDRIEDANRKKATLEADVQKFSEFIDKLLAAIQEAKSRLQGCQKEVEAKEGELTNTVNEKARLQGVIVTQEQQNIDVSKITAKRASLNESLEAVTATKERMDAANWDDEMRLSKKMDDIDRLLQQYHQLAGKLQLVGPDTKNANGVNYQISFDRHSVSAENGVSSEIKQRIKPAYKNLLVELADKIRAISADLLREKEEEKQLQENIIDKKEDLRTLEIKLKKLEANLQKEKEKAADDIRQIELETERLTQEINNIRETAKIRSGKSSKSLEAVKIEQSDQIRKMEEETQARRDAILYTVEVLSKHKEFMKTHFEKLAEEVRTDYNTTVKQFDTVVADRIIRVLK